MKRLLLALLLLASVSPARAHDVKDPVCRMTVDSDTAVHIHKVSGKTFYFCSAACKTTFAKAPARYVRLAAELEGAGGREYKISVTTAPAAPRYGQPVELAFAVRDASSGALVRDFELVHEKLLHLVIVSEDLNWFAHLHPERGSDGLFRLRARFPHGGLFRLIADFTPAAGDNQVLQTPLRVSGPGVGKRAMAPSQRLTQRVGSYNVRLQVRPALRADRPSLFTYTVTDGHGRPVRNLRPYLGAMGHLFMVKQDGSEVLHTHTLDAPTRMVREGEMTLTRAMATPTGPSFTFKVTPPSAGLYKIWAQFQHGQQILTVPFALKVQPVWTGAAPPMDGAGRS